MASRSLVFSRYSAIFGSAREAEVMARSPRLYIEGCPQHIIQRGNNRQACFFADADYAFYLEKL